MEVFIQHFSLILFRFNGFETFQSKELAGVEVVVRKSGIDPFTPKARVRDQFPDQQL